MRWGLGHAGPYNGGPSNQQFSAQDTMLWSIMSYIYPQTSGTTYGPQYPVAGTQWATGNVINTPTTWMPLDILAAQELYGLPTTTPFSGGQTFGFNCNVSDVTKPFFDFTVNVTPVITLWDIGVHNTLDLSGFASNSTVNLNPGTFSSCDGMVNNIGIAFNTKIDTVIGAGGNDFFTANNDGDVINGGAGNDTLKSGAGNDALNGGPGIDTAVFSGNRTDYAISYNATTQDYVVADHRAGSPDGTDTLDQIEQFQFADGLFTYNTSIQVTSQIVTNVDGSKTVTLFDPTDAAQWSSQASSFDPLGSLVSQTVVDDSGTRWVNTYDVTNATAAHWGTASYDAGGHQTSLMVTNDNRTHALTIFDTTNAYGWASATLTFDANWNQTGLTGTRDDGSHTISMGEVAPALDTLLWYIGPYDANVNGTPTNIVLTGSAENDVLFGFGGNDVLNGGSGDDFISGGNGADTITTGAGTDTVFYGNVSESTSTTYDSITDFNANVDQFDLPGVVTGIDQTLASGSLSTTSFDDDLAAAMNSSHLAPHHAAIFIPDSGTLHAHKFMIIDANGVAGYQVGEDYVIDVTGGTFTNLALSNFI